MKLLVVDVDGTLTDGSIIYDNNGNELKKFCVKDGTGFVMAKEAGIMIMILTGRTCKANEHRFQELKVDYLFQNIKNKAAFLFDFCKKNGYVKEDVGYIGDDLNDLASMNLAGFIGCPADSCKEVKRIAHFISEIPGGYGCVRDIIEHLLRESKVWDKLVLKYYKSQLNI